MADIPPAEQAIIARLERVAQGLKDPYAPFDPVPTQEEQFQAAQRLIELRAAQATREQAEQAQQHALQQSQRAAEQQTHSMEVERARLKLEAENERARIDLEYAKLEVEKAKVMVGLIQAATQNPEAVAALALTDALHSVAGTLRKPQTSLLIEEKKD